MGWCHRPDLSPAQQYQFLARNPNCAGKGQLTARGLTWSYRAQPTPLARDYLIKIEYQREDTPKVTVTEPDLDMLACGRSLPHVYHHPTRLCLYLPGSDEWYGSMRIDQTFVPWTLSWLYYFEEWLWSNDWKGGGAHPSGDDSENISRRLRRRLRPELAPQS